MDKYVEALPKYLLLITFAMVICVWVSVEAARTAQKTQAPPTTLQVMQEVTLTPTTYTADLTFAIPKGYCMADYVVNVADAASFAQNATLNVSAATSAALLDTGADIYEATAITVFSPNLNNTGTAIVAGTQYIPNNFSTFTSQGNAKSCVVRVEFSQPPEATVTLQVYVGLVLRISWMISNY